MKINFGEYVPNLRDLQNEVVVVGNWLVAFLAVVIPLVSAADFTTFDGIVAFAVAAVALFSRSKVWSARSVAELSAEPAGELDA
jgi:uncharacterized membrane protein